ncbi:MAG: hypothetical protein IT486_06515 [Gammaproteobacteria bacterium]|nr:hypothetical protein [Gammaproteobacteria bacterium]
MLDIERSLFNVELPKSAALQQHHVALVQLHKVIGGGWPGSPLLQADEGRAVSRGGSAGSV